MENIEKLKKIAPLITCEVSFGQNVCELMFGVNATNLDLGVQINPVKQPIQSNSVGTRDMSHCGTSTIDNYLDYRFIVLKDIQQSTGTRMRCIWWNVINVCWNDVRVLNWIGLCMIGLTTADGFPRGSLLGPSVLFGTE